MTEVFISHATANHDTAKELQQHLEAKGASTFIAPTSILPGAKWSKEILSRLRESKVVLLLACKDACESKYVNQEIGGSVVMDKTLVPVLCGVSAEQLPGWAQEFQAVELTDDRGTVRKALDSIADRLRLDRLWKVVFAVAFVWFLVWLFTRKD